MAKEEYDLDSPPPPIDNILSNGSTSWYRRRRIIADQVVDNNDNEDVSTSNTHNAYNKSTHKQQKQKQTHHHHHHLTWNKLNAPRVSEMVINMRFVAAILGVSCILAIAQFFWQFASESNETTAVSDGYSSTNTLSLTIEKETEDPWVPLNHSNPTFPLNISCKKLTGQCKRKCPNGRRNIIYYSKRGRAGINDRVSIFNQLSELAGYLCATLYVDSPYIMLHPRHNAGKRVSIDLEWSDFFHYGSFPHNEQILFDIRKREDWSQIIQAKRMNTTEVEHVKQHLEEATKLSMDAGSLRST